MRDASLDPLLHCIRTSRRHMPALAIVLQQSTMRGGFARDHAMGRLVLLLEGVRDICYDGNDDIYADGTRPFMVSSAEAALIAARVDAMIEALGVLRWVRSGRRPCFASPYEPDGAACDSPAAFWAREYVRIHAAGHVVLRCMYGEMVLAFAEMMQDAAILPLGSVELLQGRGACVPGLALTRKNDKRCWAAAAYEYLEILLVADMVSLSQHAIFASKNAQLGLLAARRMFHALSTLSYAQSTQPLCSAPYTTAVARSWNTPLPYALASYTGHITMSSYNDRGERARAVRQLAADGRVCVLWPVA